MTPSLAVFEAAMRVKSTYLIKSGLINGKNMEIKENFPSKTSSPYRIHSLLRRADARESADIIYLPYLTHIASLRSGIVIKVRKVTHRISNTKE